MMRHPDQRQLLAQLRGALAEPEAEEVFAHVADCPACRERYETLRSLRDDFDATWASFLDECAASQGTGGTLTRISGLLFDGPHRALLAVRGWAGWGGLALRPAAAATGVGSAAGAQVDRVERTARSAIADDEVEIAADALSQVARVAARRAATSELEIVLDGRVVGRVVVDARRRALSLVAGPEIHARTALLRFPDGNEKTLRLEEVAGAPYCLAEAPDLPDGSFELLLQLQAPRR